MHHNIVKDNIRLQTWIANEANGEKESELYLKSDILVLGSKKEPLVKGKGKGKAEADAEAEAEAEAGVGVGTGAHAGKAGKKKESLETILRERQEQKGKGKGKGKEKQKDKAKAKEKKKEKKRKSMRVKEEAEENKDEEDGHREGPMQEETELENAEDEDSTYRLNRKRIIYGIKAQQLAHYVEQTVSTEAAVLVHTILEQTTKTDTAKKQPVSDSFTLAQILSSAPQRAQISPAVAERILEEMRNESLSFLKKAENTQLYYVDIGRLVNELQDITIAKFIEGKYGAPYVRLFRVLKDKGQLEEKQLTEFCLLPAQEVRTIIETLYKEGIIQHLELAMPTSGITRFFSVKENEVKMHFITLHYKAISNLMLRGSAEGHEDRSDTLEYNVRLLKSLSMELAETLMLLTEF